MDSVGIVEAHLGTVAVVVAAFVELVADDTSDSFLASGSYSAYFG